MKTHLIFLCLIISGGLTNAAIQNKANSDKPSRLYVDSDTQYFNYNGNGISYDYYCGAHIIVGTASGAQQYNHTWTDGTGGGGSWATDHTDSTVSDNPLYTASDHYHVDGQFSWPATYWPTLTDCTETLSGDTWLLGWADIDVGLDPWQSDVLPLIQMEHCQIKDSESSWTGTNNYSHFDFARTAQTKMKLETGGKALSKRQNLFVFNGSATEILANFAIPPFGNLPTQSIPAQNVTIGSVGALGNDGNLYAALPDNQTFDVTPIVNGKQFYTFNVSAAKHTLTITANGNDLQTTKPEFCVGQQVTFSPSWDSDPGAENTIAHWNLPGNYVNESYAYSSVCTSYRLNPALLANLTTSCWYVNEPGGTASIGMNLQFPNGQTVSIAAKGDFTIYRPTISCFQPSPPYYAALVPSGSPNQLRLGDDNQNGAMAYSLNVNSIAPFSGDANIVQLVNASRAVSGSYGGQQSTTGGAFWLDNTLFYISGANPVNPPSIPYAYLLLTDMPGYGLNFWTGVNLCSIADSFKDYVVFKPNGSGNIYVTLGRVLWSWSASTSKVNGVWSNPTYQVIGPSSPDDSDEFPQWPQVCHNSVW